MEANGDYLERASRLVVGIGDGSRGIRFGETTFVHWARPRGSCSCLRLLREAMGSAAGRISI